MVRTRINTNALKKDSGSIELPEEVTLYCPQCKTKVADKGQCLLEFAVIPDKESKTDFSVHLIVDCRTCGCFDRPPAADFTL